MIKSNNLTLAEKESLREELRLRTKLLNSADIETLISDAEITDEGDYTREQGILSDAEMAKLMNIPIEEYKKISQER